MDICIIRTLSYFDIFDFPLTFTEIKKYLCCPVDCSDDELYEILNSISVVQENNGYYFLLGRQSITTVRSERAEISIGKIARAKIIAKMLSIIPTVEFIGLSGSVSMSNAASADDIDLFFITKKNTLWLTRFVVNFLLLLARQKRSVTSKKFEDKVCPNMFMDISKLGFIGKKRSLYTAHELIQLRPLFDRGKIYELFLNKNKWLSRLFPNFVMPEPFKNKKNKFQSVLGSILLPFERLSYGAQLLYMKKRRSNEVIKKHQALFHPIDRQTLILDMYELRNNRYIKLYEDNLWIDKDEARFYLEEKKIRILN